MEILEAQHCARYPQNSCNNEFYWACDYNNNLTCNPNTRLELPGRLFIQLFQLLPGSFVQILEFLLVKLQAQESLAQAQRAHAQALTDYNVALAQLAQTTGRVLRLHEVNLPEAAK